MNTTTPKIPSSIEDVYASRRQAGDDHDEAVRLARHAFGGGRPERDLLPRLDRARAEFERGQLDDPVEEAPEPPLPPHPLDALAAEVQSRIDTLQSKRAGLALDSLSDAGKRAACADVEAELAGAHAELERVELARVEAVRREAEDAEREQQKTVADALQRAGELQHLRQQAAERVDKAARAFADALARHQTTCAEQVNALASAGRHPEGWRTVMCPGWVLQAAFAHALLEGGGPAAWIELDQLSISRHGPLAALDPHPCDPIVKSNPKGSEK